MEEYNGVNLGYKNPLKSKKPSLDSEINSE
jgi:hypothetical protein